MLCCLSEKSDPLLIGTGNKSLSIKINDNSAILENGEKVNYGFGWDIDENNDQLASHTGWLAAFGAYKQIDMERGYYFIILSNQIRPELMDLINDVNDELYKTES